MADNNQSTPRLSANVIIVLVLVVCAFHIGRFFGYMDGPRVVTNQFSPPTFWKDKSFSCAEPAVWLKDDGWHEGRGWTFSNLEISQARKTVTGLCSSKK